MAIGGLGRLPSLDERDRQFLLSVPAEVELKPYRYYRTGPVLDQESTPMCVGFAWRQWISSALLMTKTGPAAETIYTEAQNLDEWEGIAYEGTSVRGGAKALQARGHVNVYSWAFDATTIRNWILSDGGTVVVGSNWYVDMFNPQNGFIKPGGDLAGGHAYLVVGYSTDREAFRILNSWGRDWGEGGRAWISFEDMSRLILEDGEACTAQEIKIVQV